MSFQIRKFWISMLVFRGVSFFWRNPDDHPVRPADELCRTDWQVTRTSSASSGLRRRRMALGDVGLMRPGKPRDVVWMICFTKKTSLKPSYIHIYVYILKYWNVSIYLYVFSRYRYVSIYEFHYIYIYIHIYNYMYIVSYFSTNTCIYIV